MIYTSVFLSLIFLPFTNLSETCEYSITCGKNMEACAHKKKIRFVKCILCFNS